MTSCISAPRNSREHTICSGGVRIRLPLAGFSVAVVSLCGFAVNRLKRSEVSQMQEGVLPSSSLCNRRAREGSKGTLESRTVARTGPRQKA